MQRDRLTLVPVVFVAAGWTTVAAAGILSALRRLDSPLWWGAIACAFGLALWPVARAATAGWPRPDPHPPAAPMSDATRALVAALAAAAAVAVTADVALVVGAPPGSWDALSYHLPRAALSLQAHTFYTGPVNYWAQAAHPVYSTALLILPAVLTSGNVHAWAAWQMAAYGVAAVCVYRLARHAGGSRPASGFAALVFALVPSAILEAPEPMNDLVLAAISGVGAIAVVRWIASRDPRWLVALAAAGGLGLGIKGIFPAQLIMLGTVGAWLSWRAPARRATALGGLALAIVVAVLLAAPSGYLENLRRFGHLLGPSDAVAMSATMPFRDRLAAGAVNTARLATDFVSLDGLPPVRPFLQVQHALRQGVSTLLHALPASLLQQNMRVPFVFDRPMVMMETQTYWGVAGLLLLWPAVLRALVRGSDVERALALGAVAFLVALGFAAAYDPYQGRYFLSSAVLAAPLTARFARPAGPWRTTAAAVAVALTCLGGVCTGLMRNAAPFVTIVYGGRLRPSIWTEDYAAQLMRNYAWYADAVRRYDALVPDGAVVADALGSNSFEFPLFGPSLRKRPVPLGGGPIGALPAAAEYVVFTPARIAPRPTDIHLGADWWLRRLTSSARSSGR